MLTKIYYANGKNRISLNYIVKYKAYISTMIDKLDINTGDDAEDLVLDLENIHSKLYDKLVTITSKEKMGYKLLEKRLLSLEMVMHNINAILARFRNDEDGFEDDNIDYTYEDIIEDLEDDVREELLCI